MKGLSVAGAAVPAERPARMRPLPRRGPHRPLMAATQCLRPALPAQTSRPTLQSVSIAVDIIDALSDAPELSLSELARRVGVAKSTAHRTCAVLTKRGLLDRTETGGYRLGLRFVEYGHLATERTAVKDRGLPLLVELRNALGETVQIGVPAGADVVYVERVEGQRALRYTTNSRRSPIHRSSAGKVLAAYNPDMVEARMKAGSRRAPGTRSSCPGCSSPSSSGCGPRGSPAASTRPSWACRHSRCRSGPPLTVR